MPYIQRSSEKKKQRKKKLIISLVIMVVLGTGVFFRDASAGLVHTIFFPVNKTFEFVSKPFTNIPTYFSSKTQLQNRNEELEDEIRMKEIESLSIKAIQDQNQELRQILNIREGDSYNRAVGQVILTPPFSPFDTFVVRVADNFISKNNETDQMIEIGNSVFVKNILVGEVAEIHDKNIIVRLYSTFEQTQPVRINNDIIAEAQGQGSLSFQIELPRDVAVELGEPIYSMEFPESIVGFVEKIETLESSSFKTIYFQYPFSFNSFSFVEIDY